MYKKISWTILIYGMLCGIYYNYQHLFFFQPIKIEPSQTLQFANNPRFTEAKIPFDSTTIIDVVRFLPKDSTPKGVVLFFHGNRYNVEHYSPYANYFTHHGYECWMPDYPGYGRSTGEMSIELLRQLADQLYKMALSKYPATSVTLYGKSLGTGIAAYLASQKPCKQLVLETPYYSLESLAAQYAFFLPVGLLTRFNLPTHQYLGLTAAPITVMHGTNDELIPLTNAAGLINKMKKQDHFYMFKGGKHNNLPANRQYHHIIDSLMVQQ